MPLDLTGATSEQLPTWQWAATLLSSLARAEDAGRRPPRVTEPRLETWSRFRGRLTSADLVEILFEDAAVLHPLPFTPNLAGPPLDLRRLPEAPIVDRWLSALAAAGARPSASEYISEQARALGLPARLGRSELHSVKPHQRVLELPGTGGQLAFHLVTTQQRLTLQDNFVVACATWQEVTLAGAVALELDVPHTDFVSRVQGDDMRDPEHPLRKRSFDFVVGLAADKGGRFRVEDELAIWFPSAKVLLV